MRNMYSINNIDIELNLQYYNLLEITVIYRFEFMDIVDVNMKQNEMPYQRIIIINAR